MCVCIPQEARKEANCMQLLNCEMVRKKMIETRFASTKLELKRWQNEEYVSCKKFPWECGECGSWYGAKARRRR